MLYLLVPEMGRVMVLGLARAIMLWVGKTIVRRANLRVRVLIVIVVSKNKTKP